MNILYSEPLLFSFVTKTHTGTCMRPCSIQLYFNVSNFNQKKVSNFICPPLTFDIRSH